jgi:hypothetical protein
MTGRGWVLLVALVGPGIPVAQAQDAGARSARQSGITDEAIGRQYPAMSLKRVATDPNYGVTERRPVTVQGGYGEGAHNVYRFLNALRGPQGEVVHYRRIGSCCEFKTKRSSFDDGKELLEVYEVVFEGARSKRLYFNWFDDGEALIPAGFTGVK